MAMVSPTLIYITVIILIGMWITWRVLRWLQLSRERRRRLLQERQRLDAITTSSPVADPLGSAKDRGIHSIENRFTVTRRLLIPTALIITLLVAGFPFMGQLPATLVSVLVAMVTVLVGIAARPMVENAIAGLVIAQSRIVNLGDTVRINEYYGTIEDITMTHTTIKLWDWRRYVLPNSQMLGSSFLNYSLFDRFQWAYVEFWVAYDADLTMVEKLACEAAASSPRHASYEPPAFWVMEMGQSSVRCWVAAWADTPADAWMLGADTRTALVKSLRAHGIDTHTFRHSTAAPTSPPELLRHHTRSV